MNILKLSFGLLLPIFFIQGYFVFISVDSNKPLTSFLEMQLIVIYFAWLFYYIKRDGLAGIFTLFLLCLSLFNFQKIFLGSFIGENYRVAQTLIQIDLSEKVTQQTLFIYSVFTYLVCFSYSQFTRTFYKEKRVLIEHDPKLFTVGKTVMLFFLAFACYRSYLEFTALIGKAYTDFYTEEGAVNIPSFVRLASIFFQVGFMIILASVPSKRNFWIFSVIYLAVFLPNVLTGLRATFAVSLLIIFWYYINIYNRKVKIIRLLIGSLIFMVLMQGIASKRSSSDKQLGFIGAATTFLYQQSQSMYVLSLYIQYQDNLVPHSYPFVLDPIVAWALPSGQSETTVEKRSSLGHQLTYSLNKNYYLAGASLGSNFIAELYEFGIIGITIGAVLFAYFIALFSKYYRSNRMLLFLSLILIGYFLIAPRSTFFPSLYFIFRCLIIYMIILYLFRLKVKNYISWR